ncbi:MAG: TonB-dependent siderophore receptor, partial [Burkholderiales bacterium]
MKEANMAGSVALTLSLLSSAVAQSPIELQAPEVEVEGESAYGPVDGYVAGRSATATRTDTAIRDIPASVQVISRDVIEDQNALNLFEALQNASNVRSQDSDNSDETFVIRGFDIDTAPARDGVGFKVSGSVGAPDMAGVERVEVLKGPASVLYGTSDAGGFVNLVSKRPLAEPFYEAALSAGSFHFYRAEADLSGPLSDTLRYRFNAAHERTDSFRDYFVNPRSTFFAPTIAWRPGASTELTVFAEYQKEDTQIDSGIPILPGGDIPDVPFSRYYGERFATFQVPVYQLRYVFEHRLADNWAFRSLAAAQRADDELGKVDFNGVEDDGQTLNREFRIENNEERRYSIQNEVLGKIATGSVRHTLLAGIEYSQDDQRASDNTFELASIDLFNPVEGIESDQDLNAAGFYIQDQIRFSDAWILVAGGRFDRYKRKDRLSGTDVGTVNVRVEESAFSPRVGVVYQPSQTLSFYANYAESFRPQIGLQQGGSPVGAEEGTQYETGFKLDLFEQAATLTLSLFHITKKNVLATDPDESNFVLQTGEQRSRGLELDMAGEVLPGLSVIANLGVTDAEVTDDPLIVEGTDLPNAPRWSGRLWSTYRFRQGP